MWTGEAWPESSRWIGEGEPPGMLINTLRGFYVLCVPWR
jgi:hypothetical protein